MCPIQFIPPLQGPSIYEQANKTIWNIASYFMQSAAMRQKVRDNEQIMQFRQQQMGLAQQRFGLEQQRFGLEQQKFKRGQAGGVGAALTPSQMFTALGRLDDAERDIMAGVRNKTIPSAEGARQLGVVRNRRQQIKGTSAPTAQSQPGFLGRLFAPQQPSLAARLPKPKPKEITTKARRGTIEDPVVVTDPFTKKKVNVVDQTAGEWLDDRIRIRGQQFTENLATKQAQAIEADALKTTLDINQSVNLGNVSAVRKKIAGLEKEKLGAENKLAEAQAKFQSYAESPFLQRALAGEIAGYQKKIQHLDSILSQSKEMLAKTSDIAKTTAIATQLQNIDPIANEANAEALVYKMFGQRRIKNRETAKQIFDNHVKGRFSDEAARRIVAKLLTMVK